MVSPAAKDVKLCQEFDVIVSVLKNIGLNILVMPVSKSVKGSQYLCSKDWISFNIGKVATVFPMSILDRQRERNDVVFELLENAGHEVSDVIDFTEAETEGVFMEGMSSVVLDTYNKVAYSSVSSVSDPDLFIEFCEELEYTPLLFNEENIVKDEILKTSKIITICKDFILVCSVLIQNKKERKQILTYLKKSGREIIYVELNQIDYFVNEVVQCYDKKGASIVLISKTAISALKESQKEKLSNHGRIEVVDCTEIEKFGKHSIGAMMNEIME